MEFGTARAARRELAFVVILAALGIALVMLVAFMPWYQSAASGDGRRAAAVQSYLPVPADPSVGIVAREAAAVPGGVTIELPVAIAVRAVAEVRDRVTLDLVIKADSVVVEAVRVAP